MKLILLHFFIFFSVSCNLIRFHFVYVIKTNYKIFLPRFTLIPLQAKYWKKTKANRLTGKITKKKKERERKILKQDKKKIKTESHQCNLIFSFNTRAILIGRQMRQLNFKLCFSVRFIATQQDCELMAKIERNKWKWKIAKWKWIIEHFTFKCWTDFSFSK